MCLRGVVLVLGFQTPYEILGKLVVMLVQCGVICISHILKEFHGVPPTLTKKHIDLTKDLVGYMASDGNKRFFEDVCVCHGMHSLYHVIVK